MGYETKNEYAYKMIRKKITNGKLVPGEHLNISALASQAGTSTIPIREALKQLQTEGLIEFDTHKGAKVASFSTEELHEYYMIRAELEGLAGRLAVANKTPAAVEKLEQLLDSPQKSAAKMNEEFHKHLYRMANADKLYAMIFSLWDTCYIVGKGFAINIDEKQRERSMAEHREILKALKENDQAKVDSLIKNHILSALDVVISNIRFCETNSQD